MTKEKKQFSVKYTEEEILQELRDIEHNEDYNLFLKFLNGQRLFNKRNKLAEVYNKSQEKEKPQD